jgi:putative transposase
MKKRTKKDLYQRFYVLNNGGKSSIKWTDKGFTFWSTKGVGIVKPYNKKELKKLPSCGSCDYKVTIKYESPGRYYLLIPLVTKKKQKQPNSGNVIAFDPGVRTFQTGYTDKGQFVEYGKENIGKLFSLGKKMNQLQSKIDRHIKPVYPSIKEKVQYKNRRKRWRIQMGRLGSRIKNLKRDMHWKLSREIVQENKHVLISRFQVSSMIRKETRKIGSETVKKMLNWSHFEFRQRLKHKAQEFDSVVHEVGEAYSSKACGQCGRVHWKLGGSKTFTCPHCQFTIDRDFNGARNIFLMNLESHLELQRTNQRSSSTNPVSL